MKRDPFAAIADPTRREIIDLLFKENMNINQLADHFSSITRQAVSKQLKYLEESGLVSIKTHGRERYCYLKADNLEEINNWISRYKKFWNKKLDNLDQFLENDHEKD
ncbi:MAG: ArsR/SmtB family transcription factor [Bacteroidales bacterium]